VRRIWQKPGFHTHYITEIARWFCKGIYIDPCERASSALRINRKSGSFVSTCKIWTARAATPQLPYPDNREPRHRYRRLKVSICPALVCTPSHTNSGCQMLSGHDVKRTLHHLESKTCGLKYEFAQVRLLRHKLDSHSFLVEPLVVTTFPLASTVTDDSPLLAIIVQMPYTALQCWRSRKTGHDAFKSGSKMTLVAQIPISRCPGGVEDKPQPRRTRIGPVAKDELP
jgi:hypothetical protein